MANYTKGEYIKQKFADELVNCDTHFDNDQLVKVLDICDKLGIPDMYEALKALIDHFRSNDENYYKSDLCTDAITAIAKADGK